MKLAFDVLLLFFGASIMYLIVSHLFTPLWMFAVGAWVCMSIFFGLKLRANPAISFWAGFLWMPCMLFPPKVFLDICTKLGLIKS